MDHYIVAQTRCTTITSLATRVLIEHKPRTQQIAIEDSSVISVWTRRCTQRDKGKWRGCIESDWIE